MIKIDSKKYYYLKLKDNFFDSDEMIVLENMPDGFLYVNILLKLYLRSLKNEGKLMFNDRIAFNPVILAQVTRHNVGVIEKALKIFKELGLIDILDNGAIYLLDIQNFIGQSTTEADRIRKYRKKIDTEKESVQLLQHMSEKSTPQIELVVKEKKEKSILDSEQDVTSKESKKPYGSYKNVMLTDEEYKEVKAKGFDYIIEKMSAYLVSSGKTYKNHKATIDLWSQKEVKTIATSQGYDYESAKSKFKRSTDKIL